MNEPSYMRMPKVGDRVIRLADEMVGDEKRFGIVKSITAEGATNVCYEDGSEETYDFMRDFFNCLEIITPIWVALTDEEIQTEWVLTPQNDKAEGIWFGRRIQARLKEKNEN